MQTASASARPGGRKDKRRSEQVEGLNLAQASLNIFLELVPAISPHVVMVRACHSKKSHTMLQS